MSGVARTLDGRTLRSRWAMLIALTAALLAVTVGATPALAAPAWNLDVNTNSTATAGGRIDYHLQFTDITADPADGTGGDPIVFTASLPSGVTFSSMVIAVPPFGTFDWSLLGWSCTGDGPGPAPNMVGAHNLTCRIADAMAPHSFTLGVGAPARPVLTADVSGGATGAQESVFGLSGAGAAAVSTAEVTRIAVDLPAFGIDSFDGGVTADASGTPYTQAGGHPYGAMTMIDFNTETNPNPLLGPLWPVAAPRQLQVDLPPGLVGDPTAAQTCSTGDLAASPPTCPPASQIGTTIVRLGIGDGNFLGPLPVYNVDPPPDAPARFGFNAYGNVVTLDAELRSGTDYGFTLKAHALPEGLAFTGTTFTLWGFPADDVHTPERACPGQFAPEYVPLGATTPCANGGRVVPFLRNPTSCTAPGRGLTTTLKVDSWKEPGRLVESSFVSHALPGYPYDRARWGPEVGVTGCDQVPFDPTFAARPAASARAGSPTGFTFDLDMIQPDDPRSIGQSDLKKAVVTLPAGVRVSPASAQGLGACSPEQIRLNTTDEPTCPDASKVGDVKLTTPLLDDELTGAVYLAKPFDNPFNSLVSVYIVVRGHGLVIKLSGKVDTDPSTGQLTATFDNNPQAPFSNLHLAFNDGPRAPLVAPDRCGTYTTHAVMTGWNGRTVSSDSSFTLAQDADGTPCKDHGFAPGFNAGTENPVAGRTTQFHLQVTRPDQDQQLAGLTVKMPQGLTGYVSRVSLCGEADAAHGTCPAASKIGDVTVGSGAGTNPFYITNGQAYLGGPYKGAPYGLSIVVPAVAGPFDLGNVNVRSALYVDKHDATLRVDSDPLPTILQGIPLDVRDIRVNVNRPGFMLNPTSCAEKRVDGTIVSTLARATAVSSRFQVGDCASLGFRPRMVLTVGGRGHLARGRTTPLTARITMPPRNQAGFRFVRTTLPQSINARLTVINDACTRLEFETNIAKCNHARAGTVTADTPLLSDPLKGSVYFVKNGHPIPDVFLALRGQVTFDLIGRVSIPGSKRLAVTFNSTPDVPVRSLTLRLFGDSRNGSVGAARNLCSTASRRATAQVDYLAQNGDVLQVAPRLKIKGCGRRGR